MKHLFLFAFILPGIAFAQFQPNNDAVDLGEGLYTLTPDAFNQAGSIWYKVQTDLRDTLVVAGKIYFGTDPTGADGICFVIQDNCLAAGGVGGGIGYGGAAGQALKGRSLAVEFDTYRNVLGTGDQNNYDPVYDHIAVLKDSIAPTGVHIGTVNHSSNSSIVKPVPMIAGLNNVKDGKWYDFVIVYNPTTDSLTVDFNNTRRISLKYDVLQNVFNNNPFAYWGFTSSTGGSKNLQQIQIQKTIANTSIRDTIICPGTSYQVQLPPMDRYKGTNVALNKVGTASSGTPIAAFNGNQNDRWNSVMDVDPQWIYVDLGTIYDLDSVILYWEYAAGKTYHIETANEGADLTNPASWTIRSSTYTRTPYGAGNPSYKDVIKFTSTNTRYVRMYGLTRQNGYGYSLWEFEVYGLPKYIWSPNDGSIDNIFVNHPVLKPLATTTYTVKIPDACSNFVSASFTVTIANYIPFGHDTTFRVPASALLYVTNDGGTYHWYDQPEGGNLVFTGTQYTTPLLYDTKTYYVEKVGLIKCERTPVTAFATIFVEIPNLFTPNGDGKNDVFEIKGLPLNSTLRLFNRWGNKIYENSAYDNTWSAGKENDALYYYELVLKNGSVFKGWLQVIK